MKNKMVRASAKDDGYEYIPLGKYVVSAPSVCRGRPTFKNTPIEVAGALDCLAAGQTIAALVASYQGRISKAEIEEAISLAAKALVKQTWTNN